MAHVMAKVRGAWYAQKQLMTNKHLSTEEKFREYARRILKFKCAMKSKHQRRKSSIFSRNPADE
jgi:hypothetical protein